MKTPEQRAQHDDFELREHYDFSQGIRGKFYRSQHIQTTIEIDQDIAAFLTQQAKQQHIDYQEFINHLLRDYVNRQRI